MIRTFTITAPLGGQDPEAACATLQAAGDKLRRLYPNFGGCQAVTGQGVLTLTLKVSARDQWACSRAARKIGSNMLLRLKIPADAATMEMVSTAPTARTLTGEQARGYRKPKGHLNDASEAI